jgi:hypothetical protein
MGSVTTVEKTKPADPGFHLYFLVDGLPDIFSLGVIVYEIAAGNRRSWANRWQPFPTTLFRRCRFWP